jgi:putative hydrolase of the HAD superfamily
VLFDVDGVLVHPWRFRNYLAREHGIQPEATRSFFQGPFTRCVLGESDLYEVLGPFLEVWGWPGSLPSFIETWFAEENAPNTAVLDYVDALRTRGIRCHVASTQERHRARFLSRDMGFARRFDSLLFSCDLGAAKPDPEYFRRACRRLKRPPAELLLVDDAAGNVEAARAEGWQAVLYTGPESLEEVSAELERPWRRRPRPGRTADGDTL